MTVQLPELLDAAAIRREMKVSRAAADAIIRQLPIIQFADLRKTYVKRDDLARLLDERTSEGCWKFVKTGVPG
ncbi:MAG: hypothetical protein H0W90_08220 [Actinobacteria bacterium]|nr:hypothetical protein [Actinomycetota bacterium]